MFGRAWIRNPEESRADPWDTLAPQRQVLAVARNLATTTRLLDVIPAFDGDLRVQVLFTIEEGSAFRDGVAELLHDLRARVVPWRQAVRTRFDLAVSATANGALHRLKAPLLVLPHGAGHNRLVPAVTGHHDVATGLGRRQLVRRGRVVPAVIALSHQEQLDRLRRTCPRAADRAIVMGDPCFDRMVASLPLRDQYRQALGVGHGQRLLVLTSTWGPHSLFGRHPRLLHRWVAELPIDRYRVALVLHPNVWSRHSGLQIDGWLAEALNAGLMVIPPREGWRAALIAADWIVGDHGSVTYYGAMLERPTLLAAFGAGELDAESPLAAFGRTHPRLDPRLGLRGQLEGLTATPVRHEALGMRGHAAYNLRTAMYELMRLEPPKIPPRIRPVPPPVPEHRHVSALRVVGSVRDGRIELDRFPATVEDYDLANPHLLVDEREVDRRLLESAAIFVRREPSAHPDDEAWAKRIFAGYPGAFVVAVAAPDGSTLVALPDGRRLHARGADVTICASAIYVSLFAGRSITGKMTVVMGARKVCIGADPIPAR